MNAPDRNARDGAAILPDLARGLVDLSDASHGGVISLPYPSSTQRALDRIVLACLREGLAPPSGVPDLVGWCTVPFDGRWPSAAASELLCPEATLLNPQWCLPTRSCAELASYGHEGVEQDAVLRLHELAQTTTTAVTFEQCRDFLIERIFVTSDDVRSRSWKPAVWRLVKDLYQPFALVSAAEGCIVCPGCGLSARAEQGRIVWCEGEICERGLASGRDYPPGQTLVLNYALRIFLALPGRTERSLVRSLAAHGITATLVPGDVGVYRLDKAVQGRSSMQVFDRLEPTLLAARLSECSGLLAVVPDRLTRARASFLESVRRALPEDLDVDLSTESDVVEGALGHA
jgi:hypothetical protein